MSEQGLVERLALFKQKLKEGEESLKEDLITPRDIEMTRLIQGRLMELRIVQQVVEETFKPTEETEE